MIDRDEAGNSGGSDMTLGLNVMEPSPEVEEIFTTLTPYLEKTGPVVGRIQEVLP